ncbi:MAG TPA: arylamine N-acetyltransferase [Anaerolineae bacterium]|nr:arylamine N-acetyltransferase [Anaerolineae bacterium]
MDRPYPVLPAKLLERYLSLLGVQRRMPSQEALDEIIQAQLARVPFENISKLYYKKHQIIRGLPSLELFLDGIERFHFGGTCYLNNYYLYLLLANLGYEIKLCGADMSNPDVHLVSMVTLENHEYLIDVGYAAPFLTPLPRDLATDYSIVLGHDRYVLKPQDERGHSRMELYRDGILKHGYLAKPMPRQIDEFTHVIVDSYRDDATFMNALLLARFYPDRAIAIHNLTVMESDSTESNIQILANLEELVQAIVTHFEIPAEITADVVKDLGHLADAWN